MHRAVLVGAFVLVACGGRSPSASGDAGTGAVPRSPAPSWIEITVDDAGANAVEVEAVAMAIEQAAASVGAVEHVYGELDDARSITWVAIDADDALEPASALREALVTAQRSLPAEASSPVLTVHRRTVVERWLTFRSPVLAPSQLGTLAGRIREQWMRRPGVRGVWECATEPRTVVQIDDERLAAFGVDPRAIVALVLAGRDPLRGTLPPEAVDREEIVAGGPALAMMIEVRQDPVRGCIARTADGEGAALRVELEREALAELDPWLEAMRGELPADVGVELEPSDDGEPVRVAIDAADPEALETIEWRGQPGTLVVERSRGRAVWIGLPDREAADAAIAGLAGRPGLRAAIVPREPVAIAVAGPDAQRLSSIAPRLAEQVAAVTGRASPALVPARTPAEVLVPDRQRAADVGITVTEIVDAVRLWSSEGLELGRLANDERVVVRIGDGDDPRWLERATVTGRDGDRVPLSSVARLEPSPTIDHARCERMRCVGVVVDATVAAGVDLDALGRALALESGETMLRMPLPPR